MATCIGGTAAAAACTCTLTRNDLLTAKLWLCVNPNCGHSADKHAPGGGDAVANVKTAAAVVVDAKSGPRAVATSGGVRYATEFDERAAAREVTFANGSLDQKHANVAVTTRLAAQQLAQSAGAEFDASNLSSVPALIKFECKSPWTEPAKREQDSFGEGSSSDKSPHEYAPTSKQALKPKEKRDRLTVAQAQVHHFLSKWCGLTAAPAREGIITALHSADLFYVFVNVMRTCRVNIAAWGHVKACIAKGIPTIQLYYVMAEIARKFQSPPGWRR